MTITVQVTNLRELRRALKAVDDELPKALRDEHKAIAEFVVGRAQGAARERRVSAAIKARGSQTAARVAFTSGRRGDALAAVLGQVRRSGWFAARRYRNSRGRQFPRWLGTGWDVADLYQVGPAIESAMSEVVDLYADAIDRVAQRAGLA